MTAAPTNPTITPPRLRALCPRISAAEAVEHADALEPSRAVGGLLTPLRVAHFMAQVLTETAGLTRLSESLNYRDPARLDALFSAVHGPDDAAALIRKGQIAIASRVYAERLGNGDEASGDGWRFRGRGYLQITGRDNYRFYGRQVGVDLEAEPGQLERPPTAGPASARYWQVHDMSRHADADDIEGVTRLVNPALAGLDDRRTWLSKTKAIWLS